MTDPLKYLSEVRLAELLQDVSGHRGRYRSGDFLDLSRENGWAIESSLVKVNIGALAGLDGRARSAGGDIKNSIIVYNSLVGMTPALAIEERVWTRLTHVECLGYARARWMSGEANWDEDTFHKQIVRHFFGRGLNGIRDDNAVARLWWNMHIATTISKDWNQCGWPPISAEEVLSAILKLADVRLHLVERSWTGARLPLARNIVKMIRTEAWLTERGANFNEFMKVLNREGGGILLEALSSAEADAKAQQIMNRCVEKAKAMS